MYQFTADGFTTSGGARALDAISDIKDVPQKLLMAAFQLHSQGKVDQRLLLDDSLKNLITRDERKALKRREFNDDMQIVAYLDQMIDLMHQQSVQTTIWNEMKTGYAPSILNIAEGIERTGILQHSKIFGDAFWDDKGRPFISGDKLAAIRAGTIDSNDPDYATFLDKVEVARMHLRQQRQREDFFARVAEARQSLATWENEQQKAIEQWQDKLRQHVSAQVIAFAEFTARIDQMVQEMKPVVASLTPEQKRMAARALNTAVSLSIMAAAVPDAPVTTGDEVSVTAHDQAESIDESHAQLGALSAQFGQCSTQTPMMVDGKSYNFLITDQRLCNELLRVVPAKGQTVQLSDTMSLRGNADGTFYFTITDTRTRAECLSKAPKRLKRDFLEKWARNTANTGNPCVERVFQENTITSRNMNAMIEAWLYSGGQAQTPVPFDYFLSKWFLESRHGNLMDNPNSSALGMNQFVRITWVDQVLLHGERLGYGELRDRLLTAAANLGITEAQLKSDPGYVHRLADSQTARTLHRQYTADPYHSALLGSQYSLSGLLKVQEMLESGELVHPLGRGRTDVTSKMGYMCHMLGPSGCKDFFTAFARNPDRTVKSVLARGAYSRNSYMFEMTIFKRDRQGEFVRDNKGNRIRIEVAKMTLREFNQYLETFGFDDKPMQGLQEYRRLQADALAINQNMGNVTFLNDRDLRDNNLVLKRSQTSTVALATGDRPTWLRQMVPAQAERNPQAVSSSKQRVTVPAL